MTLDKGDVIVLREITNSGLHNDFHSGLQNDFHSGLHNDFHSGLHNDFHSWLLALGLPLHFNNYSQSHYPGNSLNSKTSRLK